MRTGLEGVCMLRENTLAKPSNQPARALAEAKKWQRGILDEFWELPGDAVFPVTGNSSASPTPSTSGGRVSAATTRVRLRD
jgi:hypothetical protein